MGTLYEFLREARLEQFYPAFRANGITRSESLINLGMPEFCALGITATEDRRRLVDLVNIIKSVHSSGLSDSPTPSRRGTGSRQHPNSSGSSTSPQQQESSPGAGNGRTSGYRPIRNQPRPSSRGNMAQEQSSPASQHMEPDRVPNYSVASYMDMLQYMSESSESESADDHTDEEEPGGGGQLSRKVVSPSTVRASSSKGPIERIKHSKAKNYNYGVHKVITPSKTRSSRSGPNRISGDEKIKVCVRKRPPTRREQKAKDEDIVVVESTNTLSVNEPKLAVDLKAYTLQHEFVYDEVFDESCSNDDVYLRAARPLISCIFNGGTATCFAYGQTGAGKTHTMLGNENVPGLYLLAGQDIFSIIQSGKYGRGLHVWISFFEIYCGQLFDLLNRRNRLHAREDGSHQVCIAGLTETEATSVTSLVQILEYGNSVRSKGATGVNPDSSRSHAVLQLDIRNSEDAKLGKMSFIDLAGSERASDVTDTDKQTRLEGAEINQSLLALKECIRSIDQDSRHTPFRQSKLTHILKDSFVGNSRTCMIANISPTQSSCENTLNTLRYADRVKELKRDSVRSSSVGQAMNLLMNIPPTAPTIFHPSNIMSSSTPMRAPTQSRREKLPPGEDIFLDPLETPIRGHNLPRRLAGRDSSRKHQPPAEVPQSHVKLRTEQPCAASPVPKSVPTEMSSRSHSFAAAASQGATAPPPDASPSESDHTDTDSCNVTHPTYLIAAQPGGRQLPVAQSTDTEFDFPTSDFNNLDEINDLNRTDSSKDQRLHHPMEAYEDQGFSAAASSEMVTVNSSLMKPPAVTPVLYKSVDPEIKVTSSPTAVVSPPLSNPTQRFQSSEITSPQLSKHPPSFKKALMKEMNSDDSIDEEEMLKEGPHSEQSERSSSEVLSNQAMALSKPGTSVSASKRKPLNFINKHLMIPLPADSSDLTKFTQRPSLKPSELPGSGINDLSPNSPTDPQSSSPHTYIGGDVPSGDSGSKSGASTHLSPNVRACGHRAKSPIAKLAQDTLGQIATSVGAHPQNQSSSKSRQLPKPRGVASPSHDHQGKSVSPPCREKLEIIGSQHIPHAPNEPASQSVRLHRHTDGSESQRRRRRSSHSPTGEVSDDSADSIRASLSDQGQGGYRIKDMVKSGLRKERSDPMLALDLQRKKHTLPDPDNISKMLVRCYTPKTGLAQGSSGWKVLHNEIPRHKTGSPAEAVDAYVGRDYHSGPSSLTTEDHVMQDDPGLDQRDHFSDGSNYSTVKGGWRDDVGVSSRTSKGKQLPQVPESLSSETKIFPGEHNQGPDLHHGSVAVVDALQKTKRTSTILNNVNPAIMTEKLVSGAMFSPIHPQPVTSVGTRVVSEPSKDTSVLLQPTPVTAISTSDTGSVASSAALDDIAVIQEARMHLVSAHEDQLAMITSLCKYEMRLLLNAKKVSGRKGFDDYLRRVSDILHQKMTAITSLQDQIKHYRSQHGSQAVSTASSVSLSESSANIVTTTHTASK